MYKLTPYQPRSKKLAQRLRNNSTISERILWKYLRKKQMLGYDFNRQKPLGSYVVDFYCIKLKLAIEIDGASHELKDDYDNNRDKILKSMGIFLLHFTDKDVKTDTYGVLVAIKRWIRDLENTQSL